MDRKEPENSGFTLQLTEKRCSIWGNIVSAGQIQGFRCCIAQCGDIL
jgi:hypothetical protein